LAGYFFDSSALVKLYHPEGGTPVVDQIVKTSGNQVRVSRLTVAELTSAFAIKVRTQSISREDAEFFLRQFRKDIVTRKLEVFSIGEAPRPFLSDRVTREHSPLVGFLFALSSLAAPKPGDLRDI
jgi:hypothetical protein